MENIEIKGSHGEFFIPEIKFNGETGVLEISGESYLEDTVKFYTPLISWIEKFMGLYKKPITLEISLTYFNTSTSRSLLDMLNLLRNYEEEGGKVTINWYLSEEDIDMQEEIEDLVLDSGVQINTIIEE